MPTAHSNANAERQWHKKKQTSRKEMEWLRTLMARRKVQHETFV